MSLLTSSIAYSNECVKATSVIAGAEAPCSGLLISTGQAKQCLKCEKVDLPAVKELLRLESIKSEKYKSLSETLKIELDVAAGASTDTGFALSTVLLFAASGILIGLGAGFYAGSLE